MVASLNGHVEVVDKLLQHGATVDWQGNVMSQYAHTVSESGMYQGVSRCSM